MQVGRVLVVDDDPLNRRVLARSLEREGFQAAGVEDGESALASMSEDPPDVVLLDILMPGLDGMLAGEALTEPGHRIQGGAYPMPSLPLLDPALVDGFLQVPDSDAIAAARRVAREEGIFAGFSSGAVVSAAERLLAGPQSGKAVVVVLADSGMKYLSTDLWRAGAS